MFEGTDVGTIEVSFTGGAPLKFVIYPDLPLGMSFNTSTGLIYGSPVVSPVNEIYTVHASNPVG